MGNTILPGPGYDAALWGAGVGVRRERRFLAVRGRAPGDMLNGLLSGTLPGPLGDSANGVAPGSVSYSTLLDAKGKMITDLRIFRDPDGGFLLDLPWVGESGALSHFRKYLPPRMASVESRSDELTLLTVIGPEAPPLLERVFSKLGVAGVMDGIETLAEGSEFFVSSPEIGPFRVTGNGDSHAHGWDLLLPERFSEKVRQRLDAGGAVPLTETELALLRIEKGRPAFGEDMDETIIPLEAGIHRRAIDNEKGCYTGQEVIIRIRDRGHVNKELRGLLLGDAPAPGKGQELFMPGRERSVGWITSSVISPAFGETIALGYLRRGVGPGDLVRVGGPDGPEAKVRALGDEGWVLD